MKDRNLGNYELVRFLARGGMAGVYLAREHGSGREVALKILDASWSADPGARAMFYAEARLCARLDHPNLAAVHDVACIGEHDVLAMEYLDGADLADVLSAAHAAGQRVPYDTAMAIVAAAAAGLDHAHRRSIVHRDVSPSNIMVTRDGRVKVIDFGIAQASCSPRHTSPGSVRGKPSYMSPEQVLGHPIDARSDVFSLGIVLYELVTGTFCFDGTNDVERMRNIVAGAFVAPSLVDPDVPAELERVILTALDVDPARRFASAAQLGQALARVAAVHGWCCDAAVIARAIPEMCERVDLDGPTIVMRAAA